jgi:hypothetical protein
MPADHPIYNELPSLTGKARSLANLKPKLLKPRQRSCRDRVSRDLKESIIRAAEEAGFTVSGKRGVDAYLHWMAVTYPRSFGMLLAKVLPLTVKADVTTASVGSIRVISVPSDYYTADGGKTFQHKPSMPPERIELVSRIEDEPPE